MMKKGNIFALLLAAVMASPVAAGAKSALDGAKTAAGEIRAASSTHRAVAKAPRHWGHGPVYMVPHHHMLAAKNFCLMHVDRFVKAAGANKEDHVMLAHLCSRGEFHEVWRLTGGGRHELRIHGNEAVHKWEVEVREAARHLMKNGVPSEAWRGRIMGLAGKAK